MARRAGSDPGLLVLISLAAGPRHGHSMLIDIQDFAGERLGPGTLYGALERLEQAGLVEPLSSADRRTPYRLTAAGQHFLAQRVSFLRLLTGVADARASR
jgi:DNA-binding PadR family transcriptional regulator